jgi:hypothetical protein
MTEEWKVVPVSELEGSCSSSEVDGCCDTPLELEDGEIESTCRLFGLKNRQPIV